MQTHCIPFVSLRISRALQCQPSKRQRPADAAPAHLPVHHCHQSQHRHRLLLLHRTGASQRMCDDGGAAAGAAAGDAVDAVDDGRYDT